MDEKEWAKMMVARQNFALTKTFEVYALSGEKIIVAAPAPGFEKDKVIITRFITVQVFSQPIRWASSS